MLLLFIGTATVVNSCCRGRSGESDVIIRRSHVTCDVTTDAVNDHQQTVDTRVRVELSLSNCASLLYLFATYTTDELISHVEAGIALSCCTTKPQRKWRASLSCETQHVTICSKPQLLDAIRSHSKPVLAIRTNGPCRRVRVQVRVVSTGLHCFRYTLCSKKKHVTTFLMIRWSRTVRLERFLAHLLLRVQAIDRCFIFPPHLFRAATLLWEIVKT